MCEGIYKMEEDKAPCISVVMPVYNCEKYLPRAIESVLYQSFDDFELILVDDGSIDGSGMICDEYKSKDSRIRVIHSPNKGPGPARNTGMQNAIGEFIYFCDSDDILDQRVLENLVLPMSPSIDLVCMNFDVFDENGNYVSSSNYLPGLIHTAEDKTQILGLYFKDTIGHSLWTRLFRRKVIVEYGLKLADSRIAEDCMFVLMYLLCIGGDIQVVNYCGYHYYLHSVSLMRGEESKVHLASYLELSAIINSFIENNLRETESYSLKPLVYVFFLRQELLKTINKHGVKYLYRIWDDNSDFILDEVIDTYLRDYRFYYRIIDRNSVLEMRNIILYLCDGNLLMLRIRNKILYRAYKETSK